ncbi:MAG: PDZ domain-containing protein [Pirellula sp.]|jgi:C-terminal processing protease CtpA/Prc
MKKYMFGAPIWCMATLAILTPSLQAQDNVKEEKQAKKSSAIVVTATGDNAKDIEKKVLEALEKAGVADDVKEKVLAQLEKNTVKIHVQAENMQEQAEALKNEAEALREHANRMTIQMSELPATFNTGEIMTRVLRTVGDQKYRIGVQTTVTTTEGEEPEPGVKIEAVFPDTPASEAGIKEGDLVLEIDGEELKTVDQLTKTIQVAGKEGKEITLQIKRDDESLEIKVKPSEIEEIDQIAENIQLLRAPQSGWVFEAMGNPGEMSVFGSSVSSLDLKKELEEIRNEIREIKEMLKELKK